MLFSIRLNMKNIKVLKNFFSIIKEIKLFFVFVNFRTFKYSLRKNHNNINFNFLLFLPFNNFFCRLLCAHFSFSRRGNCLLWLHFLFFSFLLALKKINCFKNTRNSVLIIRWRLLNCIKIYNFMKWSCTSCLTIMFWILDLCK